MWKERERLKAAKIVSSGSVKKKRKLKGQFDFALMPSCTG